MTIHDAGLNTKENPSMRSVVPNIALPPPHVLKRVMQSLAMLDAILEEEWACRYFSFNAHWAVETQMGSMRNGQGDDLFAVFDPAGCFMRGSDHASKMSPSLSTPPKVWPGVLEFVPEMFSISLNEPSFHMEDTTFCRWFSANAEGWREGAIAYPPASDPDGASWMLSYYQGGPARYCEFAAHYYEIDVPVDAVTSVYRHAPLSPALVKALGSQRAYEQILIDAAEIGYPVTYDG
jgi:hypothetical protein